MLPTASYVSFKGTIESVLAWANVKNAGTKPPTVDKHMMSKRSKDIFSVMVTPDRIPKFFIPSLDVEHIHVQVDQEQEAEDGSPSPDFLSPSYEEGSKSPSSGRSCSEPCVKRDRLLKRESLCKKSSVCCADGARFSGDLERAADHSDPATRAALSLPHLQKITTPYGFLALGEIPHITRKESLFFEHEVAEIRTLLNNRKKSTALGRSRSSPVSDLKQQKPADSIQSPIPVARTNRSASWETITNSSLSSSPLSAPSSYTSLMKDKSKFQILIKKHLTNIKRIRSNSSSERLADRTLSSPSA